MEIMRQAPVTIFVLNTEGRDLFQSLTPEEKVWVKTVTQTENSDDEQSE
jgi:hypothetical protein